MVSGSGKFFIGCLFGLVLFLAPLSPAARDVSLGEAIQISQEHSYRLKSARADSARADHEYKAAGAARYPTLSVEGVSYYIDETATAELPFGQSLELGTKDNYQIDVRLSAPLYTGGRLAGLIGARRAERQARAGMVRADEYQTALECQRAYLGLMVAEALLAAAEASRERIEILRKDVLNLHANGLADSLDILETELAYQQVLQMTVEKGTDRRQAEEVLAKLLGLSPGTTISPSEVIGEPEPPVSADSISVADIKRVELDIMESRLTAARQFHRLARADFFPALSGYVGYSAGKPNRNFIESDWNDNFIAGLALNWEFNLGGRTVNSSRAARQSVHILESEKRELEEGLILQTNLARDRLMLAFRRFDISRTEYRLAQRKYHLAELKQEAGHLTLNRLLEMEAELTSAEQLYQASMISFYIARAEFLYSLGSPDIFGGL